MSTTQQQKQQLQQVFDLNDLEDDLLESASQFDLESVTGESPNDTANSTTDLSSEAALTLESILNEEEDDFDTDELLKSFQTSVKLANNNNNGPQNTDVLLPVASSSYSSKSEDQKQMNHSQYTSLMERNGCVCKLANLKQISTQLVNAIERSDSGMPTAMAVAKLIAVGTSRGLILLFDALQTLKLYITTEFREAVSALSFNNKCDRLLVGNATGMIFMFDATSGKCLRTIVDAHPNGNAVLNLKFTDDSKLAVFSDSGGSVFMLEFKRVMGVRGANSTCLFSGSRGEVCIIEPLKFEMFSETLVDKLTSNNSSTVKKNLKSIQQLFNKYTLLAMASFTKVFVVTLKPKLTVLFTFPLTGNMKYLPIINWQLVIVQRSSTIRKNGQKIVNPKRFVSPILACARQSTINYFQVDYYQNENDSNNHSGHNKSGDSSDSFNSIDFKFIQLQKSEFNYNILNFCWLNAKTLAILDEREKIHICDIRSNEELQVLNDLSAIQLTYNSTFFKSLATGGYVSKALAYAGENACYNTIQSYLGQFFMLGTRSVVLFSLQTWSTRIDDFINDNSLDLALDLALNMFKGETKALVGLPIDTKSRKEKITQKIIDLLYLYVNRAINKQPENQQTETVASAERHYKKCSKKLVDVCIDINRTSILFNDLYNLICCDQQFEGYFLESLEEHILQERLTHIPASILKNFIEYYAHNRGLMSNLELCLLKFEIESLDLHNLIQLCKRNRLLDAFIHLYNKALGDFITPIEEIIQMIYQPLMFLSYETASLVLKTDGHNESIDFFNKLLVYVHVCLCGQSYPYGEVISDPSTNDRVRRSLFDYLTETRNQLIDRLLDVEKQNVHSPLATKYSNDILDPRSNLGNYPILRIFLNFSTLDFLNVISMSFNEPSFEAVIGLDRKQHLIDILIEIGLNSSGFNYQLAAHLFTFLARQIANENNNIKVDDMIFSQIIEYLCSTEDQDRTEEREQTLLALLKSPKAGVLTRFNADRLLTLSLKAKFYRTCEILYETRGQHSEIIECYLNPENSLERQNKIFDIVRGIIQNKIYNESTTVGNIDTNDTRLRSESFLESKEAQIRRLQKKLITYEAMSQMISINPCECIFLLWIEMNTDLKYLINAIKSFSAVGVVVNANMTSDYPYYEVVAAESELQMMAQKEPKSHELLFKFMKGLFDLAELIKPDRKYIYFMSQLTSEYCELYIDLVCVYEPDKILSVFTMTLSDYAYSIDECLRICRKRKVWDGAAYLLEKSGQIKAAFDLKSEKLCGLIRDLETRLIDMTDGEIVTNREKIDGTLVLIVQLCQRNSQALNETVKEQVWFSLFDEVMRPIQKIQAMETDKIPMDSQQENRLDEARLFFKNLGSYLINSMMGYLNLTTIIDRIICDPMYGASNFGDIRDLMIKMLDVCAYEQILLTKTANLVSQDVYSKMAVYKRYAGRSVAAKSNYCHLCSKRLEPTSLRDASLKSDASMVDPLPLDLSNQQVSFEVKAEAASSDISVCIFHCGHSFHDSCLEINGSSAGLTISGCPVCNLKGIAKAKKQQTNLPSPKTTSSPIKSPTRAQLAENGKNQSESQSQPSFYNRDINFSARQLSALKSIRSRKGCSFILNGQQQATISHSSLQQASNIQRQSKLKLAPANLCKFIR